MITVYLGPPRLEKPKGTRETKNVRREYDQCGERCNGYTESNLRLLAVAS